MKKFFTLLLLCSLGAFAASALIPDEPTNVEGTILKADDGSFYAHITGNAPTRGREGWNYSDLEENVNIKITATYYDEDRVYHDLDQIALIEDVEPGAAFEYDVNDLTKGYEYNFNVYAVNEDGESWGAYIYNLYCGFKPAIPTIKTELSGDNLEVVTLTIVTPTAYTNEIEIEEDLTVKITHVVGYSYDQDVVKTFEDVTPGETLTVQHEVSSDELSKNHTYFVVASTEEGTSERAQTYVFVGYDIPGTPAEATAEVNADGSVTVTWEAPEEGTNKGQLRQPIYYDVVRSDNKVIAEKTTELSVVDPADDFTAQTEVYYTVSAYNNDGKAEYSRRTTDRVIVGPASKLPFADSFSTHTESWGYYYYYPNKLWSYPNWYLTDKELYTGISAVNYVAGDDGDVEVPDGMIYAPFTTYNYWGDYVPQTYVLTSGMLNFEEAVYPVASLYYVPLVGANTFDVVYNEGETTTTVASFEVGEGAVEDGEPNWVRIFVPLTDLVGKNNVTFGIKTYEAEEMEDNCDGLYIDEILIDDYPYVDAPTATVENETKVVTITWEDPSTATQTVDHYEVIVNGETVAEDLTETSYEFDGVEGETYEIAVVAVYEDGEIETPASETVSVTVKSTALSNISLSDNEASVELFNLQGIRIENPAAGTTVIRRATLTDGSVTTAKVVVR
ncbi:MAG: fibronectin type III domain-containing protein [Muribaculaceae bacterium]|nr:fibronectin type III domain-containing protein [Muribaculaceae bacterium]